MEGAAQKADAIKNFINGKTVDLLKYKAALKSLTPDGVADKIPANFLPRLIAGVQNNAGILGAAGLAAALGFGGYAWNRNRYKKQLQNQITKVSSFQRYTVEFIPGGLEKAASAGKQEVQEIMQQIYNEDPSYWPYGLDILGHQSVYMIRDNMTKKAAGFVGWQVSIEKGKKIGSYSIGILPEYRQKGFAKEAVAKVLREKAASVDEVRSYICSHNFKSKKLANSLGITIQEKF